MDSSQISNKLSIKYVFLFTFFLVAVLSSLTENGIFKSFEDLSTTSSAKNSVNKTGISDFCFDLTDPFTSEFAQNISTTQLPIKKGIIELYNLDCFEQSYIIHTLPGTFSCSNQPRAPVLRI